MTLGSMNRNNSTLRPSNLTGGVWPGTMQSGPAGSTTAPAANPLPMGSGCCDSSTKSESNIHRRNQKMLCQNQTQTDLHYRKSVTGVGSISNAKDASMVNFRHGLDGRRGPPRYVLRERHTFLRHVQRR